MNQEKFDQDLLLPWLITVMMMFTIIAYLAICLFFNDELRLEQSTDKPVLLRTIFYVVAICTFPLVNFIRFIMLRLNQTMPGGATARGRYLITVLVSMSLAESLGIYGLVLFVLGDEVSSLYILCGMALLAMILYRPKEAEYAGIKEALNKREG